MEKSASTTLKETPLLLGIAYAGLLCLSTLRGYFHLVELPWYATQFAYAAVIVLAGLWVFYSGETSRIHMALNIMLFQMLPGGLILIWSAALWIYRREPLSLILRGSSLGLYQILLLFMVMAGGILFGSSIIRYTAMGFVLANTLILLDVMRRNGAGATIGGMLSFLLSLGSSDNAISTQLEVQDLTFGIAILWLYYLLEGKNEKRRGFYLVALGFYFLLGFKRILFPAVFLGALYYLIMKRLSHGAQRHFTLAAGILLIGISLGYVVLIRSGLWFDLCDRLGIDLMGRQRLYGYVKNYYTLSPFYPGLGNGMVSKILEVLETTGNRRLHSDVLRLYIELGMSVFLLWCLLTFVWTYLHFDRRYSPTVAMLYMAMTILMFVTFLTDNTLEKFCPEIAWHLLPMAAAFRDREQMIAALHAAPVGAMERTKLWTTKNSRPARLPAPEKAQGPAKTDPENSSRTETVEALRKFRQEKRAGRQKGM